MSVSQVCGARGVSLRPGLRLVCCVQVVVLVLMLVLVPVMGQGLLLHGRLGRGQLDCVVVIVLVLVLGALGEAEEVVGVVEEEGLGAGDGRVHVDVGPVVVDVRFCRGREGL